MSTGRQQLLVANEALIRENQDLRNQVETWGQKTPESTRKEIAVLNRALKNACKTIAACAKDCDWLSQSMYMNSHENPWWQMQEAKEEIEREARDVPHSD